MIPWNLRYDTLEFLGGKNRAPDDITHDDTNFQSCTSSGETYNDHKF